MALLDSSFAADPGKLTAGKPLALTGTHGRFDFLTVDAAHRRLLAAHTGNESLDVIDLDKEQLVKAVPTGAAQSSAVDAKNQRYYVAVSKPPQMAIVDAEKLTVLGQVPLPGPADIMAFDATTSLAYVGHDDAKEVWVVDPAAKKIAATVALPGEGPEDVWIDGPAHRAYQAVKLANTVAVIDTEKKSIVEKWATAPAEGPHGMAFFAETSELAIAGANGKLSVLSTKDGHLLASADIAKGVDQIACDSTLHRIYCASGAGKISVLSLENGHLTPLPDVTTPQGARSIAVDQKTHTVWIAYAKGDASFAQPFSYVPPVK